jgi:hypothetical protein
LGPQIRGACTGSAKKTPVSRASVKLHLSKTMRLNLKAISKITG